MFPVYFIRHSNYIYKQGIEGLGDITSNKLADNLSQELKQNIINSNLNNPIILTSPVERSLKTAKIVHTKLTQHTPENKNQNIEFKIFKFLSESYYELEPTHYLWNKQIKLFKLLAISRPVITISHDEIIYNSICNIDPKTFPDLANNLGFDFCCGYKLNTTNDKLTPYTTKL